MIRFSIILWLSLFLVGCQSNLKIKTALFKKISDSEGLVNISISNNDAQIILDNEIHFYIVLEECDSDDLRHPVVPYHEGVDAERFSWSDKTGDVSFSSKFSLEKITNYHSPCVKLEGGNMLGRKIITNKIELQQKSYLPK